MVDSLLRALMVVAGLATGAAAFALLLGAAGFELSSLPHAVVLISSSVLAFVGFFAIQLTAQHRYGAKQFNLLLKQQAPKSIRWICNGLIGAAFGLWFFLLAYRKYEPPPGGISSLIAGTFCMFVAPAAFLLFYSYWKLRPQLNRRCSRDHEIPVGARFCPQCGEQLRPVA